MDRRELAKKGVQGVFGFLLGIKEVEVSEVPSMLCLTYTSNEDGKWTATRTVMAYPETGWIDDG